MKGKELNYCDMVKTQGGLYVDHRSEGVLT